MREWRNWQTRRSQKPHVVGSTPTFRTSSRSTMITKIVTVTCKKDLKPMIRQAESIQKFVEPCEHLVIIEDEIFDKKFWLRHLSKYYTKHTLVIKSYNHLIDVERIGWVRQQALKLLAALDCEDEYLILDSKDFFIRPCSLADWNGFKGSNLIENIDYYFDNPNPFKRWRLKTALAYSEYFNTELLLNLFNPITPFVFDVKYLDKDNIIKHVDWFLNCFSNDGCEFYFYSYMAHDLIKNFKPHRFKASKMCDPDFKSFDVYIRDEINEVAHDEDIVIAAVHRDLIAKFNSEQKAFLNNWIKSLGLVTEL